MLFFAVTLGFFVENQREHYIESKKEKQYVRSLVQDLKEDTAYLAEAMNTHDLACKMIDTLISLLKSDKDNASIKRIYYLARIIPFRDQAILIHDKSFEQLKNSGSLRLIHKQYILDSLSSYYEKYKWVSLGPSVMEIRNRQELFLSLEKLFDMQVFQEMVHSPDPFTPVFPAGEPALITNEIQVINEICARYHFMYGTKRVLQNSAEDLLMTAKGLLRLLQTEYDLD